MAERRRSIWPRRGLVLRSWWASWTSRSVCIVLRALAERTRLAQVAFWKRAQRSISREDRTTIWTRVYSRRSWGRNSSFHWWWRILRASGSSWGRASASARRPCLRAFRHDLAFPASVLGPVECCAFSRRAASALDFLVLALALALASG